MVESTKSKVSFLLFMRHGERADQAFESVEDYEGDPNAPPYDNMIEHDPPLTQTGLSQVYKAGVQIKKRIDEVQAL